MKVLVGITTYNSNIDILAKSLDMLAKQVLPDNVELAINLHDNTNGKQKAILTKLLKSNITYTTSNNIGFGASHNKVMADNEFDYYLCLNPDGIAHHNMINALLEFAKNKQGIFEALQFPAEHPKYYCSDTGVTDWCSGCAMLIPKQIYKELGGFDDQFFMYMEDVDISWRVRKAGYKCHTVKDAMFFHDTYFSERDDEGIHKMFLDSDAKLKKKYKNNLSYWRIADFSKGYGFAKTRW